MAFFGAETAAIQGFRKPIASALLATTALGAGAIIAPATAYAQEARSYEIPAGPLAVVLNRFGEAADVELVYDSALTNGVSSPGLKGSFGTAEALSRLLAGAGLTFRQNGSRAFTLERAPRSADGAIQLGPVRVEGEGGDSRSGYAGVEKTATSPVQGYVARRSATATKTDTPIIETPQAISIVTADQVRMQKAQTLQDALGYTAGVMTGTTGMNPALADSFWIRGFQADPQFASFYRDGLRFGARIFNGKQEPYGLERIEILKGPSSILYGATAPGGIVNTVSKRPTLTPIREINLEYGSFDRKQISADFGGAMDAEGHFSYRLTGLGRESDTFIDYGRDDRIYVAPALTWSPSPDTSLTLLAHYQHQMATDTGALPVAGTLQVNPNGRIARSRFLGEPDHSDYDSETYSVGYEFRQQFGDGLTFSSKLRYLHIDLDYEYVLIDPTLDATQRRINRQSRRFTEETNSLTLDNNLIATIDTGALAHTILIGADYSRSRYNSVRDRGALGVIDIYAPVYGVSTWRNDPWRWFIDTDKRTGIYVQDQMKLGDKLVILLGGRHDWFSNDSQTPYTPAARTSEKQKAFTARAGLVYLADNGLAPYLSFSQSFEPTSGQDRLGERYRPSRGEQYEAGLRYQPPGSDILLTASLYQLTRTNVQTPDPVDTSFSVQTGEVRARGLELEAKAQLLNGLSLIAAYSYTDTKVTKSNIAAQAGTRFVGVPRNMASLWVDYDFQAVGLEGFSLGGGVRYVSRLPGDLVGGLPAQAYTLFDAVASYTTGPWRLSVNVRNLTDKTYIPNNCRTTFAGGCSYGQPRSAIATLSYNW